MRIAGHFLVTKPALETTMDNCHQHRFRKNTVHTPPPSRPKILIAQFYWPTYLVVGACIFFGLVVMCLPRTREAVAGHKRKGQRRKIVPKNTKPGS